MAEQMSESVKISPMGNHGASAAATAKPGTSLSEPRIDPTLASMGPDELRQAMADLGCPTQIALARSIGVDRSTVSLWLEGRVGVPRPVAKLLRMLVSQERDARRFNA